MAAFSSLSEPCTALAAMLSANSARMVPGAASAGFVAPIKVRKSATALSFSRMAATLCWDKSGTAGGVQKAMSTFLAAG